MTHPLIRTGRSLAAMFLAIVGLGSYGCGDTATVTQPAELQSLSVSNATLEPPFSPATANYKVRVSNEVTKATVNASPRVAGDIVRIDNVQALSQPVDLNSPGSPKSVVIVVTENGAGGGSKTYTVDITRATLDGNNSLSNLVVSPNPLEQVFQKDKVAYTVSVLNGVSSVAVTPTLDDTTATMTVNGVPVGTGQATSVTLNDPAKDAITIISIVVTAPNQDKKEYTVFVSRGKSGNNNLQSLTLTPGTLDKSVTACANPCILTLNVPGVVANNVTSVTVTPELQDPATATMTVNGTLTANKQAQTPPLPVPGSNNSISIIVTAQNGSKQTYTVNVVRGALDGNNSLKSLTLSPGTLDKPVSACTDKCTLTVPAVLPSSVTNITVTPELQSPATATMTVNGTPTANKQAQTTPLPVPGSNNSISIIVTAQNGSKQTYTVNVVRGALDGNNSLKSLTLSPGTLDKPVSACTDKCTLTVPAVLPSSVTNITVKPELQDPATATMTVNGTPTANKQAQTTPLPVPGSNNSISILVTAQNGSKQTYTVNVVRDALGSNNKLSALSVTGGTTVVTLSPPFDSNKVTVTPEVTEVLVRATKDDENATMALGSVTVAPGTRSGEATFPLTGTGDVPTPISFTVTAQDGVTVKTYTISVIRPAAPTKPLPPTSAPDLMDEDDSCTPQPHPNENQCFVPTLPGITNSHDDNKTTVTRPRFSVPLPNSGETAKLYIKKTTGEEFSSSSTSAEDALIFRPNGEGLPDGFYDVTYTLSNSSGESERSPIMTPQLKIDSTIRTN